MPESLTDSPAPGPAEPAPSGGRVEHFRLRLPRPQGAWLGPLESALRADGPAPLRWAITAVEGETLIIEGARWAACPPSIPPSPSST
jgi:hypothetical protein